MNIQYPTRNVQCPSGMRFGKMFSQRRKDAKAMTIFLTGLTGLTGLHGCRVESPIECPISELETWRAGVLARLGGWGQPPSIRHWRNIPKGRATAFRLAVRAESPKHTSVGQRPTFGQCSVIKAESLAHYVALP